MLCAVGLAVWDGTGLCIGERKGEAKHTLGVCDLTFPARASEPWAFPMIAFLCYRNGVL